MSQNLMPDEEVKEEEQEEVKETEEGTTDE
jgi:hypothetical protein